MGKILLWMLIFESFCGTDTACTFPSNMQNSVWDSSEFGEITFGTSEAVFKNTGDTSTSNWTCEVSSENTYVIRTVDSVLSSSLNTNVYFYYCFDFHEQSADSYLYYHPSVTPQVQLATNTTTVSAVCSESVDAAEFHVIVKQAVGNSVKNICISPLLGNFIYSCTSGSTDNGTINVCDTSSQTTLSFNHSQCATEVLYSVSGVFNCVAQTSTTVSSDTVFYQTLYNTDATVNGQISDTRPTFRFVCLAVTSDSNGTVSFSYNPSECLTGQTSSSATTFEPLTSTKLCPIESESSSSSSNIGLIIGLLVGFLILVLLILGALLFYFCYYKRDPNAGKPIVENTKPRFEDPEKETIIEDLELIDSRSTPVTRDEITFEAMSPTIITNGKIPMGNPIMSSPTGSQAGSYYRNGMVNSSFRRDSGIAMTEKSSERPTPRIGINPSKESMVIFNGDEKVISGNDTRIVPNENPNARTFKMNNSLTERGQLTLFGLEDDGLEETDELGELTQRENMPYPSLPREKSNLMPPIETTDPEKDKDAQ